MKKTFILTAIGSIMLMSLCYAMMGQGTQMNPSVALETNVNADTGSGVSTSMNGNTSTTGGTAISSTSASKESRNTSGSGE